MRALELIDELDELVFTAKPVPMTDQVRVPQERLAKAARELCAELDAMDWSARTREGEVSGARAAVAALVERWDELVRNAKPIPLTDQVRLDKAEVYDICDGLRQAFPEFVREKRET